MWMIIQKHEILAVEVPFFHSKLKFIFLNISILIFFLKKKFDKVSEFKKNTIFATAKATKIVL